MTDFIDLLKKMRENHQEHLENLVKLQAKGVSLENFPEHESIDDFINREQTAIDNLSKAIDRLTSGAP